MANESFSTKVISHKTHSYIRGCWILTQLCFTQDIELKICQFKYSSGHYGVLFGKRKTICIFDNCIQSFLLNNQKQMDILQSIKDNEKLNKQPELAGESPIFILSLLDSDKYFISIEFTEYNGHIRFFSLLNTGELYCWQWFKGIERLLYKWKWVQSSTITEGLTSCINNINFTLSNHLIWLEEDSKSEDSQIKKDILLKRLGNKERDKKYRICHQYLNFKNTSLRKTGNEFIVTETFSKEISNENIIIQGFNDNDNLYEYITTEEGVWILCNDKIGFWNYRKIKQGFIFYNFNIDNQDLLKSKPSNIYKMIKHINTEDILLISDKGRIILSKFDKIYSKIICKDLCVLELPKDIILLKDIYSIIAIKYYIFIFLNEVFYIFDIKSGILLDIQSLPYNFNYKPYEQINTCSFGLGVNNSESIINSDIWFSKNSIGFWKPGSGIYEIIFPCISNQLETLSKHINDNLYKNIFPSNYLGKISSNYHNNRLSAQYTFRELFLKTNDINYLNSILNKNELYKIQEELSKHLLQYIQNPSLILLLLKDKSHKPFLRSIVSEFLNTYLKNIDNQDNKITLRNAYHYHTPLNTTMISFLDHYNELSKQQQSIIIENNDNNSKDIYNIENIWANKWLEFGEKLISASRDTFELIIFRYPKESLRLLEDYLNLTRIWKNFEKPKNIEQTSFKFPSYLPSNHMLIKQSEELLSDIFISGERGKEHQLFINMCRLYYKLNPSLFIPFILLVQESAEKAHYNTKNYSFIQRAILAIPPALHINSGDLKHIQIIVGAITLCLGGKGQRAIWYLLDKGMWDYIFIIMNKYKYEKDSLPDSFSPQTELFHILLAWCINNNDLKHINMLWNYIPKTFGVLNLLRVIKQNQEQDQLFTSLESAPASILVNPEKELTIGIFRKQIIEMFNNSLDNTEL